MLWLIYLNQKYFYEEPRVRLAFDFHLTMFQQYLGYSMTQHCMVMVQRDLGEVLDLQPPLKTTTIINSIHYFEIFIEISKSLS